MEFEVIKGIGHKTNKKGCIGEPSGGRAMKVFDEAQWVKLYG